MLRPHFSVPAIDTTFYRFTHPRGKMSQLFRSSSLLLYNGTTSSLVVQNQPLQRHYKVLPAPKDVFARTLPIMKWHKSFCQDKIDQSKGKIEKYSNIFAMDNEAH